MHRQLINGAWVDALGGGFRDLINPATEEVIEQLPYGGAADATAAVDAAAAALDSWAALTTYQRGDILTRAAQLLIERADELAPVTTEESGKPLAESRAEWLSAPNYLLYAAEAAKRIGGRWIPARVPGRRIDVVYRPVGVVGVITAWNFPVYNPNRAVSSALAAGCSVVIRPSSYTPRSAMLYAAALHDAGVPPGVVNVVNGDAGAISDVMLDDARVRKIAFTGSVGVGKRLMDGASRTITDLALELGGNAPAVIFPDVADLAAVARSAVSAKFRNCGQACITPQRFIVHESIVTEFAELVTAATLQERVGNGLEEGTTIGPLINAAQRDRVHELVVASVDAGAGLATGGHHLGGPGYFYEPTVLADVPPTAPINTEEVFGPVMPIVSFATADEAITIANDSAYGLAAMLWTQDLKTAMTVSEQLDCGLVGINDWYPVSPEAPFGGTKQSGLGRESGVEGVHEYLDAKARFFGGMG